MGVTGPRVWKIHLDQPDDDSRWWQLLSSAERARALELVCPDERRRYTVAHAALRAILGRVCGVRGSQLQFGAEPNGRPYLITPGGPPIDFNLSHSGEWALVAVTPPSWRVGVDIERIRPDLDVLGMARRMYQPAEFERLQANSDEDQQRDEYFQLWSAKEAYVKAIGIGLAGMRTVMVDREPGAEFGDVLTKSAPESVWRVRWLWVAPGYAAATTVVCDDCVNADQVAHRHAS